MDKQEAIELQTKMKEAGLYTGNIDGIWGPKSQAAFDQYQAKNTSTAGLSIAWSAKVSKAFVERVVRMSEQLKMDSDGSNKLMACMAWESGETFSPSIRNGAGSGATGLIQAMGFVALAYYYSSKQINKMSDEEKKSKGKECCDKLAALTAEEQLEFVYWYFKSYTGKLKTLADVYMVILYPKAVGKPDDYILFQNNTISYRQNIGLDINKDTVVTKQECTAKVYDKYLKGMLPKNRRSL